VTAFSFSTAFGHAKPFLRYHFSFSTAFRHARPFLRYRFLLFNCFRARKTLLALPFSPFQLLSGTQDPSCVTVFSFSTAFGHARPFLRYRFLLFNCFRARKTLLALPFSLFQLLSGTQEPPCVTVFSLPTAFGHTRTFFTLSFTLFENFKIKNKSIFFDKLIDRGNFWIYDKYIK
jgi:hypothetical protein